MDYFFESKSEDISAVTVDTLDFDAHLHDHIELGYLLSGSSEIYLEGQKYYMKQGDFFVVFPNQIHRYDHSKDLTARMIIFSPELIPEFRNIFSKQIPISPVISECEPSAKQLLDFFYSEYETASPEVIRGLILAFTGILFRNVKFESLSNYNISTLKNVLIFCNEHYTEPITIDDVAASLHISRSHIAHIFKDKLNTTFSRYISKKRVDHACSILKNSTLNVTESAFISGFDSVRTFNRIFLKYTGLTPREYRKNF